MQDVAKAAGVSLATVSRALSPPHLVSPALRDRVRASAEKLRYVPNLTAGSLAGNRSRIVAVVVPAITNAIFSETIDGLSSVLAARDYQLLLGQTWYREDQEAALVETFLGRRVDGLVLTGATRDKRLRDVLQASGVPIVETWDLGSRPLDMQVGFSNQRAAAAAADYLAERGYQRLGFIGGMDLRSAMRFEGFVEAAQAHGLRAPVVVRIPSPAPSSLMAGGESIAELLRRDPKVDAVFCSNDMIAMGALLECQRRGWAVPGRVAVMGFSNLDIAKAAVPPLSTVHVNAREIGVRAAGMVLERIETGSSSVRRLDLGFSVIARESA